MLRSSQSTEEIPELTPIQRASRNVRLRASSKSGYVPLFLNQSGAIGFGVYVHEFDYAVTLAGVTGNGGLTYRGPLFHDAWRVTDDDRAAACFFMKMAALMRIRIAEVEDVFEFAPEHAPLDFWIEGIPVEINSSARARDYAHVQSVVRNHLEAHGLPMQGLSPLIRNRIGQVLKCRLNALVQVD